MSHSMTAVCIDPYCRLCRDEDGELTERALALLDAAVGSESAAQPKGGNG